MELENEHRYYLERPQPLTVVHGDQLWSRGGDDGEGDPTHKVKGEPTLEVSTGDCCRVHDHQVGAAWSGLETGAKVDQDVEQKEDVDRHVDSDSDCRHRRVRVETEVVRHCNDDFHHNRKPGDHPAGQKRGVWVEY